jgi:hypothetical protein
MNTYQLYCENGMIADALNDKGKTLAIMDSEDRELINLFCAAPEMYEALKALVIGPGLCGSEEWRKKCLRDAIQKGKAALAKAEGN